MPAENPEGQKRHERQLRFLVQSAKILSMKMDLKDRLREKALLTVPDLADWCVIDLVTDGGISHDIIVHGDPKKAELIRAFGKRFPRNETMLARRVIVSGMPVLVKSVTEDLMAKNTSSSQELEALREIGLSSVMIIPIVSQGRTLGTLSLGYGESGRTFAEEDFEFMQEFCHHLAVVIDNGRLYEELGKRDRAKDVFLATLSHELRNPLAPIKSALDLLKLHDIDESVRGELDTIERQFDHMARLLGDLLDVARYTQGRITLNKKRTLLCDLIVHATATEGRMIRRRGIGFTLSLPSEKIWISADATRFEQAVTNMLQNSAKFTPPGGTITLSAYCTDIDAFVSIKDTGIGIEPAELKNIFELYYQEGKQPRAGLGIGLLLVREIAKLHGGDVEAHSEGKGRGAEFIIRLPRATEPAPAVAPPSLTPPAQMLKKRVLIVDDNRDAADSLTKLLRALGADARAAYSGRETFKMLEEFSPDILLLDITMPEMDGYQVAAEFREKGHRAPIVALTGHGLREDVEKILKAGFNDHLTKPVGVQELRGVLDQY